MNKRLMALVLSSLFFSPSLWAQTPAPFVTNPEMVWRVLKIGGGGFLTGIDISDDGTTKVARGDVYGAWISINNGDWSQLVTTHSMPASDSGIGRSAGVYEIVVAPSDPARIYMYFNGYVYRSNDRGGTFTRTAFAHVPADPNDNDVRLNGPYMAVDPANPEVLYAGTPSSGLFVTMDGGASFARVDAVGTATAPGRGQGGGNLIAFDPASGVREGKTQGIYVSSYGTGVYHSTNGGSSWTLTASTPTTHIHMICDPGGTVWLIDNTKFNLHKYNGSWSTISGAGTNGHAVAVDPANGTRVFVANSDGTIVSSINGGANWTKSGSVARVASDVPWLAALVSNYMAIGDIKFDPSASSKLYASNGNGVWWSNPPTAYLDVTWNSQTAGIEELVANWIISPPGGKPIAAAWDFGTFYIDNPDSYKSAHGVLNYNGILAAWGVDYASSDPRTIVAFTNNFSDDKSSISTDGGQTWTQFSGVPPTNGLGGSIAASDPSHIVRVANGVVPSFTSDGGSSWRNVSIPGTGTSGWGVAFFVNRQIVCADRVNPTTFYTFNSSTGGFYRSTDGGATWTNPSKPKFVNNVFSAKMRTVPGYAGHIFFTGGQQGGKHPSNQPFYRSINGGTNWMQVMGVKEVWAFGFGKAAPGQSYPAIYIAGWVSNVYGIWRSTDNCATWTKLTDFPLGSFDAVKTVEGDMNTYGTVYIGFAGSGFVYGKLR